MPSYRHVMNSIVEGASRSYHLVISDILEDVVVAMHKGRASKL